VPPKNVFPEPRSSDLIRNKSYELDDQYFRAFITVAAEDAGPCAGRNLEAPPGLFLGTTRAMSFDQSAPRSAAAFLVMVMPPSGGREDFSPHDP
jgi:hypothetical protein